MKITEFRVNNFKCFQDTGTVSLAPGMNIVTGENNAGKTALLQALSCDFTAATHLSMASLPQRSSMSSLISEMAVTLSISGDELLEMANTVRKVQFAIPPDLSDPFFVQTGIRPTAINDHGEYRKLWQRLVDGQELQFQLLRQAHPNYGMSIRAARVPSHGLFRINPTNSHRNLVRELREDGTETFTFYHANALDLIDALWPQMQDRIYRFTAERFGLADSVCGPNKVLQGNASNLAEVLLNLRANPGRYEQYISLVNEILPQVKWVELEPIVGNLVRVKVWSIDKSTMREDLAIDLNECGTGIGQVLSIVYVAFTSERPQVLLIDEPQSFLHPGAVRKLIEILKRFPQHQYVISTHSASVIAASGSPEILILEATDGVSTIKSENTTDTRAMQRFLEALGARLSDVFGMDRVLWVEGATEEKTIPLLLEKMNEPMAGTAVVSVRNTGDLEGKDKKKAFEIYNSLTGKASILPREVAFVLDSEARTSQEMREMTRLSGGRARFLPRRTFENYILHSGAVCAVANAIEGFSGARPITVEQVNQCFQDCVTDARCWAPHPVPEHPNAQAKELHGAKVLDELFAKMSSNRVRYDKTEHSVALFEWIVEHDRASLAELEEFLRKILRPEGRSD